MFQKEQKIEDLILDELSNGQQNTLMLIQHILGKRVGTTKQSVYKALRVLKKNEVIVQNRLEVALSSVWLKKMADFVEKTELNYTKTDQLPQMF